MSRPNGSLSKSDTNNTGTLRKISRQNEKNSKLSKSTSNVTRTSNKSKVRGGSVSGKSLRNGIENMLKREKANEKEMEAAPNSKIASYSEELQERINEHLESESDDHTARTNGVSNASSSSIRNEVPMLQESPADAIIENQESRTNKCFEDWRDFYIQIFGSIKSKSDLVVAFTHYILMKNGFRCVGLGDDRTYTEDEVGSIELPEGWNHFPKYAIRYIYNRMLHILLGMHLDQRLLINLLNTRTNVVTNITVFPEITVRATCGGRNDVLIPYPEKLAQSLYYNLMQTFTDTTACERPPKILSRTNQKNDPWAELESRHSRDVYPITEEDNVSQIEETEDVQTLGFQNTRYDSISSSNKSTKRMSWADMKPHTASVKKVKPLKAALDAAVPPLKDAIASYMETMVENWCRIYGREVMKSGMLAIQDLAEQRKMIEKYIDLAKPVTEPMGGFFIYNTRVTLDYRKLRMLHESVEKCLQEFKAGAKMSASEFVKPFTETPQRQKVAQVKANSKVDAKNHESKKVAEAQEKSKTRANYKHVQPKVFTGIRKDENTLKPVVKKKYEKRKILGSLKNTKHAGISSYSIGVERELKNSLLGPRKSTNPCKSTRKRGDTYSLQQNSTPNTEARQKRRRVYKPKSSTSAKHSTTKPKRNNVPKLLKDQLGKPDPPVRLLRSSPIKKIRFNLPKLNTPSYFSGKWPSTYRSVENLLNSSFPFRAAARKRERAGSEQLQEKLENYSLSDHFTRIDLGNNADEIIEAKKHRREHYRLKEKEKSEGTQDTSNLLQTIERHCADQIEAKRLELLEKVRRRNSPTTMENTDNIEMKCKFIQPKQVKDVGSFVQPADEWSHWEFKKKLKQIRDKEILGANQKKPI